MRHHWVCWEKKAAPLIRESLRRLEYRGYDSAGLAFICDPQLLTHKRKGRIDEGLAKLLAAEPLEGQLGLGHTRWATHGPPSDENSHPHWDETGRIAVVHNGVIENYERLRENLKGRHFRSTTDAEVLAHLIGEHYAKGLKTNGEVHPLTRAVMSALREVIGAYGIAVICSDHPDVILGARRGSPLIVGVGEGENFLASDANAIAPHTRQVVYLNDYDVVTLTADNFTVSNRAPDTAQCQISQLAVAAERGDFNILC